MSKYQISYRTLKVWEVRMTPEVSANLMKYLSLTTVAAFLVLLAIRYIRPETGKNLPEGDDKAQISFPSFNKLGILFLANRLLLFIGTFLFLLVIGNNKLGFLQSFKETWLKWDSNGYLRIARDWYAVTGDEKYDIALYPLYPILVKAANFLIRDYFLSGVFVSNLFLFVGLIFLYKLVKMEFGHENTALDSAKYLLLFPFSFFFSIVYTESVFFSLSVLTIYFIRKKMWHLGGLFGLLASFTRNQGLLLLIPVFIELIADIPWKEYFRNRDYKNIIKKLGLAASAALMVPCGTALYLLVNKLTFGDWFKFLSFQKENWSQQFGFFANNIRDFVFNLASREIRLGLGVFAPNLIVFFLCMLLLMLAYKKMRLSYIVYTLAYVLVSFSPTWLLSGPRYISGMFTLYIMLALTVRKDLTKRIVESILCVLLLFFAVLFAMNGVF